MSPGSAVYILWFIFGHVSWLRCLHPLVYFWPCLLAQLSTSSGLFLAMSPGSAVDARSLSIHQVTFSVRWEFYGLKSRPEAPPREAVINFQGGFTAFETVDAYYPVVEIASSHWWVVVGVGGWGRGRGEGEGGRGGAGGKGRGGRGEGWGREDITYSIICLQGHITISEKAFLHHRCPIIIGR